MDYVRYWCERSQVRKGQLVKWIGLGSSKFYDWQAALWSGDGTQRPDPTRPLAGRLGSGGRLSKAFMRIRYDGYRRLTYLLMDADVVAVSPSTTYRVLKSAGLLQRWNQTKSRKGTGFHQPEKATPALAYRHLVHQHLRHVLLSLQYFGWRESLPGSLGIAGVDARDGCGSRAAASP